MKSSSILFAFICFSIVSCKNSNSIENNMDHGMTADTLQKNALMLSKKIASAGMKNIKMTGDFDIDFAKTMILHHQMAVDMSQDVLANGDDLQIRKIAKGIVAVQETEIAEMQLFTQSNEVSKTNLQVAESEKLNTEMRAMMEKMKSMQMSNNFDKDYVAMMIPHHESAIEMANKQIEFGTNDGLKALSKNIVKNQNLEIESFKMWQSKNQ